MNYIILVGAFQALIAFVLSFVHKKGASGNLLSWLLALIFLHLGGNFVLNTAFPASETHKQFNTFIAFFYGPLLWMYARSLSGAARKPVAYYYMLLLPGVLAAIAYFSIGAWTIAHGGKTPAVIHYYNKVSSYGVLASFIYFGARSWAVTRHVTAFWDVERQFVRMTAAGYLFVCIFWAPVIVIPYIWPQLLSPEFIHYWMRVLIYLVLLSVCLAIIRVKFLALKYTSTAVTSEVMPAAEPLPAQKKQVLTAAQQAAIAADIQVMMDERKAFADPELTLDTLAAAMKISRNHLSEVLNQYLGRSFYQYINECRIRQVVSLMDRCKKEKVAPNILSLAFEAGFHSKSSFNQYFKKVLGCTPSAYMKTEEGPDNFAQLTEA